MPVLTRRRASTIVAVVATTMTAGLASAAQAAQATPVARAAQAIQATPAARSNTVVAISAGEEHNLALKDNGTVVAWGYNDYRQTRVPAELAG